MSDRDFESLGGRTVYAGDIIEVRAERFRYPDGKEVSRDIVRHPGAVAVVAFDGESVWLVRQPREAVGQRDMLEIPAGRLDKTGEEPLETAKRELAEEIGKSAREWEHLTSFHTSVGFADEVVHVYLAQGIEDADSPDSGEDERIEILSRPVSDLDSLIGEVTDSKTLVGLLMLRDRLRR